MSGAFRGFLDWFEGFSDNIKKAPTEDQWKKVVARVDRLRTEFEAEPTPPPAAPSPAVNGHAPAPVALLAAPAPADELAPVKTEAEMTLAQLFVVNERKATKLWRERFQKTLLSESPTPLTPAEAREYADCAGIQWDVSPEDQARREIASWAT
jgi:hypothetical protein